MAINSDTFVMISATPAPHYVTAAYPTTGALASTRTDHHNYSSTTWHAQGVCALNFSPDRSKWSTLPTSSTSDKIYAYDFEILNKVFFNMTEKFGVSSTEITDPDVGTKIKFDQWSAIRKHLVKLGVSPTTITAGTRFNSSFYNDLVAKYHAKAYDCRCNTNCSCNMNCKCNSDCGCHY